MCFSIHSHYPDPLIASKDLSCYKVIECSETGIHSIVKHYPYTFEELNFTKPLKSYNGMIMSGFHSYKSLKTAVQHNLHDYVVLCIIPKGATYYYDPIENQYVSDRIIIKEFVLHFSVIGRLLNLIKNLFKK